MPKTAVTKPAVTQHEWFESGAAADKTTPADALIETGFHAPPAQIPNMEEENYWRQRFDQLTRYFVQRGLPDWDAGETYQKGDIVRYNSGGLFIGFYVAAVASPTVGQTPVTNEDLANRQWERWFLSPFGSDHTSIDDTPIRRYRNALSDNGNGVDRLGFFDGFSVQNWHERWRGTDNGGIASADLVWNQGVVTGSGAATTNEPSNTGLTSRVLTLSIGTGAADEIALGSQNLARFDDAIDMALEARILTGANIDKMRFAFGLYGGGSFYGETNAFKGVEICKGDADANWQFISGDGSARTIVDSGLAVLANRDYIFRVEWIGQGASDNSTRAVRLFIDGVTQTTITTHLPTNNPACIMLGNKVDGGTVARSWQVRPLRFSARL